MGGAWMAAVLGFGGVRLAEDELSVHPHLPPLWTSLRFPLMYRGVRLRVHITKAEIEITSDPAAARSVALNVMGRKVILRPGETWNSTQP
jgi:trehalose/maltose hydrolase-like predicted phosphorylase